MGTRKNVLAKLVPWEKNLRKKDPWEEKFPDKNPYDKKSPEKFRLIRIRLL